MFYIINSGYVHTYMLLFISPRKMAIILHDDIYLHISSNDVASTLIPDNTSSNFTIELPSILILEGAWEIAIVEFLCLFCNGIKYGESIQIFCDIVDVFTVKDKWKQLLRNITFDASLKRPDILLDYRYMKVVPSSIKRIGLYLDERSPSFFVLHLRKRDY